MIRRGVLVACLATLLASCGKQNSSEETGMEKELRPEWADMYDAQQKKKLDRARELSKTSPIYRKPKSDPDIYITGVNGRVAAVDRKTGDYVIGQTVDRERMLEDFRFTTKSGKLVCVFMIQIVSGSRGTLEDPVPYRVYHVKESENQTDEVREARKRISFARFAEFIRAEWGDNEDNRQFIIIDAPQAKGERLL
jgi:hypothetical protein